MSEEWKEVSVENNEAWDRQGSIQGSYVQKKTKVGPNESNMYMLKTDKGVVGVWGSAVLDSKFNEVPLGAEVKVESLGKQKSENTGREYYDYKLFFRAAPMVEVNQARAMNMDIKDDEVPIGDEVPIEAREPEGEEELNF